MSYLTYKFIHLTGVITLLTSMGGLCFHLLSGGTRDNFKARKFFGATHGIGLVISLVGGFGLLARLETSALEGWVIAKLCIWIFFGGYSALMYRTSKFAKYHWAVIVGLAMLAAFLAQNK